MNSKIMAAAGSVDITPTEPIRLIGPEGMRANYAKIADQLEVNGLALSDGCKRIVVVSADLLFIGDELRQRVLSALRTPVDPECLLFAASHTHYAPMTLSGMPKLGTVDPSYLEQVASRTAAMIDSLWDRLSPVTLLYYEGTAGYNINRRLLRTRIWTDGLTRSVSMAPNKRENRDEAVRLVVLVEPNGTCICVAWNYACHPTGYPEPTHVTAEYPGVVRRRLRENFNRQIPVLFFQGFSGDLRPPFLAKIRGPKSLIRRICRGPLFHPPLMEEWAEWAESLSDRILEIISAPPQILAPGELHAICLTIQLSDCIQGGPQGGTLRLQSIAIGGEFRWIAFTAEMVAAYRRLVESYFPRCRILTVGCIDQVAGYLPTDDMVSEGGYEVDGFRDAFEFRGRYIPGIEAKIENGLSKLASFL